MSVDEGPLASRFRRRVTMLLLVAYAAFVAVVTLSPRMPGSGSVERLVRRVLSELHDRGVPLWVDYGVVEFVGNVLLFVPLGVFVGLLVSRRAWWTLLFIGTVLSGLIEGAQALLLDERVPDARDLISNSAGFLVGAAAAVMFRLLVAHRDRLVEHDRVARARSGR